MRDGRLDRLADVLVGYSTGVRKGDVVTIWAPSVAEPLVEAVYERVIESGGHPHWHVLSDELDSILYEKGSDEQIGYVSPLVMHEIETVDVRIALLADTNTAAHSRVDSSRQALKSSARKPFLNTMMKRMASGDLRWALTQFPTHASAQDAEMSLRRYEDFVFRAGLLHLEDPAAAWRDIERRQEQVREWLQGKREIRFRVPGRDGGEGSDLTVRVHDATWINCCGRENFPDGEVFAGPQGADGVVNYTYPGVYEGTVVEGIRLRFKDGRVVDAGAEKNEDFLIRMLDQDEGARFMGEIAIGTNYEIREFTKNTLFDEKIGGTFHAAVGAGYPESGSTNESGLHWDMVCDLRAGGTIEADGEVFHRDGSFLKEGWPGNP